MYKKKKIILVVIISVFSVLFFSFLIYHYFFKDSSNPNSLESSEAEYKKCLEQKKEPLYCTVVKEVQTKTNSCIEYTQKSHSKLWCGHEEYLLEVMYKYKYYDESLCTYFNSKNTYIIQSCVEFVKNNTNNNNSCLGLTLEKCLEAEKCKPYFGPSNCSSDGMTCTSDESYKGCAEISK